MRTAAPVAPDAFAVVQVGVLRGSDAIAGDEDRGTLGHLALLWLEMGLIVLAAVATFERRDLAG